MGLLTTQEGNKTQLARTFTTFVVGPFLVLAAIKTPNLGIRIGLLVSGISTIVYNAVTLYMVSKLAAQGRKLSSQASQPIRLIDIFLMGPFIIWAGYTMKDPILRVVLIVMGIGTILFNAHNYLVAVP